MHCLFNQMELVVRFPPSEVENLPVWRHVLLRALSQEACHHVETDIIGHAQKTLTSWQGGGYRLGQVDQVVRTDNFRYGLTQCLLLITHTKIFLIQFSRDK